METKNCSKCQNAFVIEPDDFLFYEKMGVPAPTLCPKCRQIRRLFVRNFRTLYKRTSSKSGKTIISMYHENQPFPVYSTEEWYADDWDATMYGKDFDFSRPFFDQYKELSDSVPRFALMINSSVDCEYANIVNRSSRCYFVFGCIDSEDCDYGGPSLWNCRECVDCMYIFKSEYCYQCIDVLESSRLIYSRDCEACTESIGLFDCRGCINCIGCVGLRNQSYQIFNKQVTKEEYQQFLKDHPTHDPKTIEYIFDEQKKLKSVTPTPYMFGSHNVDVSGNHIYHAKNVHQSFDIKSGEDSKFCFTMRRTMNNYDCGFSGETENSYECMFSSLYHLRFCHLAIDCTESDYAQFCHNSNNLFGCISLRKKDYCILNKQYTKEEYEVLKAKIIEHMKQTGEWGEFFPIKLAPFTYNESTVGENYPLIRDEALAQGYTWKDDIPEMRGQENASLEEIDRNNQYNFTVLKDKIFACETCERNYRLTDHEVKFYERFHLPLPRQCFFCRHQARMDKRLQRVLHHRSCMCDKDTHGHTGKCENEFESNYSEKQPELIYCEKCYQAEIV